MPGLHPHGGAKDSITFKALRLERLSTLEPFASRLPVKNFRSYWNSETDKKKKKKILFSRVLLKRRP